MHTVEQNRLSSFVSADLFYGQMGGISLSPDAILSGAISYLINFRFPLSSVQSVVHTGDNIEVIFMSV